MFKNALRLSIYILVSFLISEQLTCDSNFDPDFYAQYKKIALPNNTDSAKIAIRISLMNKYIAVDPNEGIKVGNVAIEIAKKANRTMQLAECYNALALNYAQKSDYPNALMNELNAESYFKKANSERGLAKVYQNMGNIYISVAQYDKAKSYLDSAIKYNFKSNRKNQLAINYMSLADIQNNERKHYEALRSLNTALGYSISYSNDLYTAEVYLLMCSTHRYLKNYTNALKYINKFDSINTIKNKTDFKIRSQMERVTLQIMNIIDTNTNKPVMTIFGKDKTSNLTNTIKVINKLLDYYTRVNYLPQTLICYELLSYAYLELGDKNKTKYYFNKHKIFNDSLTGTNQIRNLTMAEVRFNIAMKDQQLRRKTEEITKNQEQLLNSIVAVVVLCVVLVIIFILWQRNRRQKIELFEKNSIITDANIELENLLEVVSEKQQQIEKANIELNKANVTKDKFFSILSHDLKSPFTGILGLSELLSSEAENMKTKEITSIGSSIHNSAKHTFELLNQLLDWSRSQLGVISFEPSHLNINSLIDRIIKSSQSSASVKNLSIETNYCSNSQIEADDNMLSTVIRNLLNNSIKFTPTGGKIVIETKIEDQFIQISIKDNGVGINSDVLENLFKLGSVTSTLGTNNEKGTGLGLILCKEFVEKHGGKIWAESEVSRGSNFHILLPIQISDISAS